MHPIFAAVAIYALLGLLTYAWFLDRSRRRDTEPQVQQELQEAVAESGPAGFITALVGVAVVVLVAWWLLWLLALWWLWWRVVGARKGGPDGRKCGNRL